MSASEKPLHIDIPVKLTDVKVVFSIASLASEGDLPASIFHLQPIRDDTAGWSHCGYITYEAEIDPEKVMICHCADCQTLSGSAFRTVLFTREDTFKLLSGELKTYVKTGESGTKRPQSFFRNAR